MPRRRGLSQKKAEGPALTIAEPSAKLVVWTTKAIVPVEPEVHTLRAERPLVASRVAPQKSQRATTRRPRRPSPVRQVLAAGRTVPRPCAPPALKSGFCRARAFGGEARGGLTDRRTYADSLRGRPRHQSGTVREAAPRDGVGPASRPGGNRKGRGANYVPMSGATANRTPCPGPRMFAGGFAYSEIQEGCSG